MTPDRATKEIKTTDGHTVVIKTYLTYREMAPAIKLGDDTIAKSEEMIKSAIVSLDGVAENAFERLIDLPVSNYTEVGKEVTQMIKGDFLAAK